jgi:hypothetical protein
VAAHQARATTHPTEDDAKGVVSQPGYLSSWRAERSRFVQKGNVVAVYIRPEDEDRLRDALEHL